MFLSYSLGLDTKQNKMSFVANLCQVGVALYSTEIERTFHYLFCSNLFAVAAMIHSKRSATATSVIRVSQFCSALAIPFLGEIQEHTC